MAYTQTVLQPFASQRFGSYKLVAHLGRGGMADVFRAVQSGVAGFERVVVVKKILSPYNCDPKFVSMFINEAKIAARLTHPNIVQVYELGQVEGEYFMAMEYVKGIDLSRAIKWLARQHPESRAFPSPVAAFIAREICRGLQCAHEHVSEEGQARPIVHRDVSPHNIMLTFDGQVKLLDFGIAKAMHSASNETRSGALKGKVSYMAPEQVDGSSLGPQSDLFAAGVVFYEMLVGKRLFKGDNDFETLKRVKSMPIPAPSRINSTVPKELDAICLRAVERERGKRYRRAALMARDLDGFLQETRFTVEEFAEFMVSSFPPEARLEVPDGQAAAFSSSSLSSHIDSLSDPHEPWTDADLSPVAVTGRLSDERRPSELWVALGVGGILFGLVFGLGTHWILQRRPERIGAGLPSAPLGVRPEAPDRGSASHVATTNTVPPSPPAPSPPSALSPPSATSPSASSPSSPSASSLSPPSEKSHPARPAKPHAKAHVAPAKGEPAKSEAAKGKPKPKIEAFDD
jgi:eukaryotic-like serine/threonine-protein kinase